MGQVQVNPQTVLQADNVNNPRQQGKNALSHSQQGTQANIYMKNQTDQIHHQDNSLFGKLKKLPPKYYIAIGTFFLIGTIIGIIVYFILPPPPPPKCDPQQLSQHYLVNSYKSYLQNIYKQIDFNITFENHQFQKNQTSDDYFSKPPLNSTSQYKSYWFINQQYCDYYNGMLILQLKPSNQAQYPSLYSIRSFLKNDLQTNKNISYNMTFQNLSVKFQIHNFGQIRSIQFPQTLEGEIKQNIITILESYFPLVIKNIYKQEQKLNLQVQTSQTKKRNLQQIKLNTNQYSSYHERSTNNLYLKHIRKTPLYNKTDGSYEKIGSVTTFDKNQQFLQSISFSQILNVNSSLLKRNISLKFIEQNKIQNKKITSLMNIKFQNKKNVKEYLNYLFELKVKQRKQQANSNNSASNGIVSQNGTNIISKENSTYVEIYNNTQVEIKKSQSATQQQVNDAQVTSTGTTAIQSIPTLIKAFTQQKNNILTINNCQSIQKINQKVTAQLFICYSLRNQMFEDANNKYKKSIRYQLNITTKLLIGQKDQQISQNLLTFKKQFKSLSLKFTLNQILKLITKKKAQYVNKFDLLLDDYLKIDQQSIQNQYYKNITQYETAITQLKNKIDKEKIFLDSTNAIEKLITYVSQVRNNSSSFINQMIFDKKQIDVSSFQVDVDKFYNDNYAICIKQLKQFPISKKKQLANDIKNISTQNFNNAQILTKIAINNLYGNQTIQHKKQQQLNKMSPILDYLNQTQQNIQLNTQQLNQSNTFLNQTILQFMNNIIFQPFRTKSTQKIDNLFIQKLKYISRTITQINFSILQDFKGSTTIKYEDKINEQLKKTIDMPIITQTNWNEYFPNKMNQIKLITPNITKNAIQCCKYQSYGSTVCIQHNVMYSKLIQQSQIFNSILYNVTYNIKTYLSSIYYYIEDISLYTNNKTTISQKIQQFERISEQYIIYYQKIQQAKTFILNRSQQVKNVRDNMCGDKTYINQQIGLLDQMLSSINKVNGQADILQEKINTFQKFIDQHKSSLQNVQYVVQSTKIQVPIEFKQLNQTIIKHYNQGMSHYQDYLINTNSFTSYQLFTTTKQINTSLINSLKLLNNKMQYYCKNQSYLIRLVNQTKDKLKKQINYFIQSIIVNDPTNNQTQYFNNKLTEVLGLFDNIYKLKFCPYSTQLKNQINNKIIPEIIYLNKSKSYYNNFSFYYWILMSNNNKIEQQNKKLIDRFVKLYNLSSMSHFINKTINANQNITILRNKIKQNQLIYVNKLIQYLIQSNTEYSIDNQTLINQVNSLNNKQYNFTLDQIFNKNDGQVKRKQLTSVLTKLDYLLLQLYAMNDMYKQTAQKQMNTYHTTIDPFFEIVFTRLDNIIILGYDRKYEYIQKYLMDLLEQIDRIIYWPLIKQFPLISNLSRYNQIKFINTTYYQTYHKNYQTFLSIGETFYNHRLQLYKYLNKFLKDLLKQYKLLRINDLNRLKIMSNNLRIQYQKMKTNLTKQIYYLNILQNGIDTGNDQYILSLQGEYKNTLNNILIVYQQFTKNISFYNTNQYNAFNPNFKLQLNNISSNSYYIMNSINTLNKKLNISSINYTNFIKIKQQLPIKMKQLTYAFTPNYKIRINDVIRIQNYIKNINNQINKIIKDIVNQFIKLRNNLNNIRTVLTQKHDGRFKQIDQSVLLIRGKLARIEGLAKQNITIIKNSKFSEEILFLNQSISNISKKIQYLQQSSFILQIKCKDINNKLLKFNISQIYLSIEQYKDQYLSIKRKTPINQILRNKQVQFIYKNIQNKKYPLINKQIMVNQGNYVYLRQLKIQRFIKKLQLSVKLIDYQTIIATVKQSILLNFQTNSNIKLSQQYTLNQNQKIFLNINQFQSIFKSNKLIPMTLTQKCQQFQQISNDFIVSEQHIGKNIINLEKINKQSKVRTYNKNNRFQFCCNGYLQFCGFLGLRCQSCTTCKAFYTVANQIVDRVVSITPPIPQNKFKISPNVGKMRY